MYNRSLFHLLLTAKYLCLTFFTDYLYIQIGTDLIMSVSFCLPFARIVTAASFKLSAPDYIYDVWRI